MKDTKRQTWMSLLAKADAGRVPELLGQAGPHPDFEWLRAPEIGSVMVQGRTGGTGAPFNLGEMTVTRCTLRLSSGEVGHACLKGRRKGDAEAAAVVDALMQTSAAARMRSEVLGPLAEDAARARHCRAAKAAATKVDFFTMVRGED
ncbi:phosphonate C-P lyase system protein PhnG [Sedimentitalea sp. XS_ASV28]|uniref:phosphonate C-P lyase system protein PhnG n=1 Tax=Sedimentitalea sp. XS_ASV28 TaxID=3241296 RepID=UPI003519B89F